MVDGTRLHINEVWIEKTLRKYAYYWLSPDDTVICGRDNAPHHQEVSTYPHHKHDGGSVISSDIRSLDDVLDELEDRLDVG